MPEVEVRAVRDNVVALVVLGSTAYKYCHDKRIRLCHTGRSRFEEILMFVVRVSINFSHLTKKCNSTKIKINITHCNQPAYSWQMLTMYSLLDNVVQWFDTVVGVLCTCTFNSVSF